MSTIAICSEGPDLDARVDPRFGRAAVDTFIQGQLPEFKQQHTCGGGQEH